MDVPWHDAARRPESRGGPLKRPRERAGPDCPAYDGSNSARQAAPRWPSRSPTCEHAAKPAPTPGRPELHAPEVDRHDGRCQAQGRDP